MSSGLGEGAATTACRSTLALPGFRFHPTDEELVSFYLCRRVLPHSSNKDRALLALLIPDLDIYKHDPWDLPGLARLGEGSGGCYFFSPRGKKYPNSTRPNRVTASGFWKATGTDRLVSSRSPTSKFIGLKKSLVFYHGRASRGIKSDWMMHEFRLASHSNEKDTCWALCKIYKRNASNLQDVRETHPFAAEELLCSAGAAICIDRLREGDGMIKGDESSEEDAMSEETTCTTGKPAGCNGPIAATASSTCVPTPYNSSCHSQVKEGSLESPLAQTRVPLMQLRISKSNDWADEGLSSWFSPTILKNSGLPCLLPDGADSPCKDEPLHPESLWHLFGPDWETHSPNH